MHTRRSIRAPRLARGACLTVVALALGASLSSAAGAASSSPPPSPTGSFASGMVAALNGSTMEVQSATGQTTVTVASTTTFEQILTESTSAIAVGDCVRATGRGSTTKGIAASTVSVSKASSSGCTAAGFSAPGGTFAPGGAGGGSFRGRFGGGSGTRTTFPANARRALANLATADGPVTSVKGTTLTVKARIPEVPAKTTKKSKKGVRVRLKFTTKSVKVTIAGSATVTATTSATAAQLANGVCVTAVGSADTTGAITARSITISQPVKGSCTTAGFGGGFGGGFAGGFAGRGGASAT